MRIAINVADITRHPMAGIILGPVTPNRETVRMDKDRWDEAGGRHLVVVTHVEDANAGAVRPGAIATWEVERADICVAGVGPHIGGRVRSEPCTAAGECEIFDHVCERTAAHHIARACVECQQGRRRIRTMERSRCFSQPVVGMVGTDNCGKRE